MRKDWIEKLITTRMIEEKGDRGRQWRKYLDSLSYLQGRNYGTIEIIHATEDGNGGKWSPTQLTCRAPRRSACKKEGTMRLKANLYENNTIHWTLNKHALMTLNDWQIMCNQARATYKFQCVVAWPANTANTSWTNFKQTSIFQLQWTNPSSQTTAWFKKNDLKFRCNRYAISFIWKTFLRKMTNWYKINA